MFDHGWVCLAKLSVSKVLAPLVPLTPLTPLARLSYIRTAQQSAKDMIHFSDKSGV